MMANLDMTNDMTIKAVSTRNKVTNDSLISKSGNSFREKLGLLLEESNLSSLSDSDAPPTNSDLSLELAEYLQKEELPPNEQVKQLLEVLVKVKNVDENYDEEDMNLVVPDFIIQISNFISNLKEGSLQLNQISDKHELIGLLLVVTKFTDSEISEESIGKIQKLLTQLKEFVSESLPQIKSKQSNESTNNDLDIKAMKVMSELIRNLETKLGDHQKTETQGNRQQYLQGVHSRYFTIPRGLENPTAVITEKLIQKTSNTNQVTTTTPETVLVNDTLPNQMPKIQQFTLFVEQNAKQMPNQEQFIKQFQNILARSNFVNGTGNQKLFINLYPEHLGSLRIEILQSENGLIARIMASTSQAKELVESQLSSLKQSFIMQNISVEKIEITNQQLFQSERSLQRDAEQQKQQTPQQKDDRDNHDVNEEESFSSTLLDELLNIEV
ncbi:flagellar hook-length control protein FliK [Fredinandcohnia sp. 179-A 10B2 NHS]|uniref:flagellar hook-length control protein FliK n=1 Tax=Fredinandcohnia sp. 179-A 10B2 NHS TaxID=3235176 RepID=UPI0039A0BBB5